MGCRVQSPDLLDRGPFYPSDGPPSIYRKSTPTATGATFRLCPRASHWAGFTVTTTVPRQRKARWDRFPVAEARRLPRRMGLKWASRVRKALDKKSCPTCSRPMSDTCGYPSAFEFCGAGVVVMAQPCTRLGAQESLAHHFTPLDSTGTLH